MAVTPTGAPAWARTNDYSTYGGHINKANLASRGVINPKTDVGAEAFSRMVADLAAVMRTAPFCTLTLLCNDTSPAAPTIEAVHMQTGTRVISYEGDSAPSGFPSASRTAPGDIDLTFASSYDDPYGVSGSFVIQHAVATLISATTGSATVLLSSDQVLRVRAFDTTGASISDARISVSVW